MKIKNLSLWLPIVLIVILAFFLRLYKFHEPIADWHSWRQADTAAVSKVYLQEGIDILHPKYFDISNLASGIDNPNGYRMVEFPLLNVMHVGVVKILPFLSIDQAARLTTILFSLLATIFIYLIVKKYLSLRAAIFSALFYAILPFSIYYGRSVLPDTAMIASVLGGIYFFSNFIEKKNFQFSIFNFQFWLAVIFTAASLLFKPYALFFLLPMVVLAFQTFGLGVFKKISLWLFALISVAPFVGWRLWIMQFPEGIPASNWLFNEGNIRFKGAYFYWIFGERISQLILGYYTAFVTMGFFKRTFEKHFMFFISFFVSCILYLVVIARGNVQHDYYQIAIIPALVIFIGRGIDFLLSLDGWVNKSVAVVVVSVTSFLMIMLSWYHVRDYFNINNRVMVEVGRKADSILPANARVIASLDGDSTFLYHINRKGWPHYEKSTEELIQMGATHSIVLHPNTETIARMELQYKIIASDSAYIIVEH
jgi:hypothetical protein